MAIREKWIADAGLGGLPVRSVAQVGGRIAGALAYAHDRRLLHLDIKPSNIFVDPGGENAKLGDFGLARVAGTTGSALQLRPTGTPAYMAPEQMGSGTSVSSATDVYQLGATLWDFLTGEPPKPAKLDNYRFDDDERSRLLGLAKKALARTPSERPSAAEMADRVTAAV